MADVSLSHFELAIRESAKYGDNDTLPYDRELTFFREHINESANLALEYFQRLESGGNKFAHNEIKKLEFFSERMLVATGPHGFRIATKIAPFLNIYLNALGISIAEKLEPKRYSNAHSYRFLPSEDTLFDKERSWKSYRQSTLDDPNSLEDSNIIIQTDVSSFYEHIYHHRLENSLSDLFSEHSTIPTQIIRILSHLSSGRSFGLPVGGQCSRILAELMMHSIDEILTSEKIIWHRYVDDFVLITENQEDAYKALSTLSHALADYGLSLNRNKTTILTAKHYREYIQTQLFSHDGDAGTLREIDIYFDPYSDKAEDDYEELKSTVSQIDIKRLLLDESKKSQSDSYLVKQISRTVQYQKPEVAEDLITTLLDAKNINAFRASFGTIMRGIYATLNNKEFSIIHKHINKKIDGVITNSSHLLLPESNCLHFLKCLTFSKTDIRSRFISDLYSKTKSVEIRKSCINCWGHWKDRPKFNQLRNRWTSMPHEEQKALWMSTYFFREEGAHFRKQEKIKVINNWTIGIKTPSEDGNEHSKDPLIEHYLAWTKNA